MARPDFSNVWGSTNAPFTAITDTDYKAGWVFRTGAPPRRVNFDYFQNLSDQRHAWLAGVVDSVRVDVPSAATVNLTSAAPDTRGIRITGTTTITGFTISAGASYLVTFSGALTITNNAAIVTNRTANITVSAGDTCIIRATAANVVEIVCSDFLIDRGIGSGQTWQAVTRSVGVTYTNTTGRPIQVHIRVASTGVVVWTLNVNGAGLQVVSNTGIDGAFYVIVPAGASYALTGGTTLNTWLELR